MPDRRLVLAAIGAFTLAPALYSANIPRPSPDFAIQLSNGRPLKIGQYKGKVVALVFILTSCPHCQKAIRSLIEDQKEFGPQGFQALASAIEDMAQINVPEFIRQYNPTFPVGYNKVMAALDFMQHPPMVGPRMPLIAFIDRNGVIRAQYEGHETFFAEEQMAENIRMKIKELLREDARGKKSVTGKSKGLPKKQS